MTRSLFLLFLHTSICMAFHSQESLQKGKKNKTTAWILLEVCLHMNVCTCMDVQRPPSALGRPGSRKALREISETQRTSQSFSQQCLCCGILTRLFCLSVHKLSKKHSPTPHLCLFTTELGVILTKWITHCKELFFFFRSSITQYNLTCHFWTLLFSGNPEKVFLALQYLIRILGSLE